MQLLAPILQEYFTTHLVTHRGLSPATIRTYRDTWKLFLTFLANQTDQPAHLLELAHLNDTNVIAFLDHLEHERGNSIATRNLRLAAIKAVVTFQTFKTPELLDSIARVQFIPVKKTRKPTITYLTTTQVQGLLAAINTTTWTGKRDYAMFALTAQTGLRISELSSLTTDSIYLGNASHVACTGKGRKQRITPLTAETTSILKNYLSQRSTRPGNVLFPNPRGQALSSDAIQQRLRTHVLQVKSQLPELANKHITVHTLRHSAAMRFLEAGIDAAVIALWLGHETTATTSIYFHADMNIKRKALNRTNQPEISTHEYKPADPLLTWLESL